MTINVWKLSKDEAAEIIRENYQAREVFVYAIARGVVWVDNQPVRMIRLTVDVDEHLDEVQIMADGTVYAV